MSTPNPKTLRQRFCVERKCWNRDIIGLDVETPLYIHSILYTAYVEPDSQRNGSLCLYSFCWRPQTCVHTDPCGLSGLFFFFFLSPLSLDIGIRYVLCTHIRLPLIYGHVDGLQGESGENFIFIECSFFFSLSPLLFTLYFLWIFLIFS